MDTEGAIVARFRFFSDDDTGKTGQSFADDGSYLRLRYFFSGSIEDTDAANVDLVLFPFNSNRFRLGYLWDLSWGGNDIFPSRGIAAPAAKLSISAFDGYAFVGAKTARLLDENINEIESNWGVLSGAGYDFFDVFAVDLSGGVFQRGTNPLVGVEGESVMGFGGSGRLSLHLGRPVPRSADFRLYRDDPGFADSFGTARKSTEGLGFVAALEYTHLQQTLQDPENASSTVLQAANAGALTMGFSWDDFAVNTVGLYRDLAYILYSRPSFVPFQAFPSNAALTPEFQFTAGVSYFIESLHLTPSFVYGVFLPSSFAGLEPGVVNDGSDLQDISGTQVVVVRDLGSVDILPCNDYEDDGLGGRTCVAPQLAEPIYALRASVKWDASRMLSIVAEANLLVDNNETDLVDSGGGVITRQRQGNIDLPNFLFPGTTSASCRDDPDSGCHNVRLAAGVFAQARF
jgi:hypothetical protein